MKCYLDKNDEARDTFITDVCVREEENGRRKHDVYSVTYANGDVENNVIYNDENAKIIEDKLLEQATVGIDSKYKLSSDKKKGMISRIGAAAVCAASGGGILGTVLQTYSTDSAPFMVGACVAGALAIGGVILTSKGMKKKREYDAILQEINANEFRLEHKNEALAYLQSSPNAYLAFDGENEDAKVERADKIYNAMVSGYDPFSFLAVEAEEGITDEEIEGLLKRSNREQELGLAYEGGYPYQEDAKRRGNR